MNSEYDSPTVPCLSHNETPEPPKHQNHRRKQSHNQPMERSPKRNGKSMPIRPCPHSIPPNAPLWRLTRCLHLPFRSQILRRPLSPNLRRTAPLPRYQNRVQTRTLRAIFIDFDVRQMLLCSVCTQSVR